MDQDEQYIKIIMAEMRCSYERAHCSYYNHRRNVFNAILCIYNDCDCDICDDLFIKLALDD